MIGCYDRDTLRRKGQYRSFFVFKGGFCLFFFILIATEIQAVLLPPLKNQFTTVLTKDLWPEKQN